MLASVVVSGCVLWLGATIHSVRLVDAEGYLHDIVRMMQIHAAMHGRTVWTEALTLDFCTLFGISGHSLERILLLSVQTLLHSLRRHGAGRFGHVASH